MILKIEPFSGISGDMMLGALIELTGGSSLLQALPEQLGLSSVSIEIEEVSKSGIQCTQVTVVDESELQARHLNEIRNILDGAELPQAARHFAHEVFTILGEAEAAVHGCSVEEVHFHEVGAVDALIDIAGTALLLAELNISAACATPVCVGSGTVDCSHGRLPVPAPATERILRGMPTYPGPIEREMTTPTGAAILKALDPSWQIPAMTVNASGYGAGQRDLEQPNCLRLSLGQALDEASRSEQAWLIQTNLDDSSGELLGEHLQGLLLEAGALDVNLCPLLMKKGRPGQRLEILCHAARLSELMDLTLTETSAIGLRYFPVNRKVLARSMETVVTRYGEISVKCVVLPSGEPRRTPEYEDCRRRAAESDASLQEVMREALRLCDRA